ncbi:AURKAIP1/COX24 domain-containing protein [Candidatus Magnetobacterium casensis]|uniref:AURKAIP1/COX24 domain-containing protein n=1 Tax=Candidatus Magnetobacterium casense TaxID=1455061 RepID=A0ABS6S174_9BACT|nr:AURKAIP1/COX24 domain-containing protein [Candidatus Magnetobacterium casensis]
MFSNDFFLQEMSKHKHKKLRRKMKFSRRRR